MGDPHETYGATWYATVEEMQYPIMFNLLSGSAQEGDKITFETQEIQKFKSGKNMGKEYRRLKKVRIKESSPREVTKEAIQDNEALAKLAKRVERLEHKIFGEAEDRNDDSAKHETKLDEVADYNGEEINLNDIPF